MLLGVPVTCTSPDGTSFAGTAKDISIGGMFLYGDQPVQFGDEVSILVLLPSAKQEVTLPGIVRWTAEGGFGVQFRMLGARATHAISQLFLADRNRP